MMPTLYFAHAGEAHDSTTTIAIQPIFSRWYIALPLFIIVITLATLLTYYLSRRSKSVTLTVLLALLFVAGVATYTVSAPVSVLSLSLGFTLALLQVLAGLSKGVS